MDKWIKDNGINAEIDGENVVLNGELIQYRKRYNSHDIVDEEKSFIFYASSWFYHKKGQKIDYFLGNYKKDQENSLCYFGLKSLWEIGGSIFSPDALVEKAISFGHKVISSSERTLSGVIHFQLACKSKGVKYIIGYEIATSKGLVTVMPKNEAGWIEVLSLNGKVEVEKKQITEEDLGCLLNCFVVFQIGYDFIELSETKDYFYCQFKPPTNQAEYDWIKNAPFKRTLFQGGNIISNAFRKNIKNLSLALSSSVKPVRLESIDYIGKFIKDEDFKNEVFGNNEKISNDCQFSFDLDTIKLPKLKNTKDSDFELNEIANFYLNEYTAGFDEAKKEVYKKRLDYELEVIKKGKFSDYFLILSWFCKKCLDNNIYVGIGRGSACGSLVAYMCKIHFVDPIENGLIFERFLNEARFKSMPDIDLDVEGLQRQKTIGFLKEEFGSDCVASIGAFGFLKARSAMQSARRVFKMGFNEFKFTKKLEDADVIYSIHKAYIESKKDTDKKGVVKENPIKQFRNIADNYQNVIDFALSVSGAIANKTKHASGIIVTSSPLKNLLPMYEDSGVYVVDMEKVSLDSANYAKIDVLGLSTLDKFRMANNLLEKQGKYFDFYNVDERDKNPYKLIMSGKMEGVFQLNSRLQRSFVKRSKAETLEDLVVANSILRPGPLDSGADRDYIDIKRGNKEEDYDYKMTDITFDSRGLWFYQEQVMNAYCLVTKQSLSEADSFRKYISKLKGSPNIKGGEKYRDAFFKGYKELGASDEQINKLWDKLIAFSEYGFNKSHAVAYSKVGLACLALKYYHPSEYYISNLTIESQTGGVKEAKERKIQALIDEANSNGSEIYQPDINISGSDFTYDSGRLYFGLLSVKGVGDKAVSEIVKHRGSKFFSVEDFKNKILLRYENGKKIRSSVNKGTVKSLIFSGSFDRLFGIERGEVERRNEIAGLFEIDRFEGDFIGEQSRLLSANMKAYMDICDNFDGCKCHSYSDIQQEGIVGQKVAVIGRITFCKIGITKTGKRYSSVYLKIDGGEIPIKFWEEQLQKFEEVLVEGEIVMVSGTIKHDDHAAMNTLFVNNYSKMRQVIEETDTED